MNKDVILTSIASTITAIIAKQNTWQMAILNSIMPAFLLCMLSLCALPTQAHAFLPIEQLNELVPTTSTAKTIQVFLAITILSLAPAILIMTTSFVRISVVLSFVRTALGLQQSPPSQILVSLALFLTLFIMSPTIEEAYEEGIRPLLHEELTETEALPKAAIPFKKFMLANTRPKDLDLFVGIAKLDPQTENIELPFHVVTCSFIISELRRAFEIGFLVFLPFLVIDILISSILMAMGMMMMPPVMVSMPFKIIFFVVIDGWYLIVGTLVKSFAS